jgi:hypothetical protein
MAEAGRNQAGELDRFDPRPRRKSVAPSLPRLVAVAVDFGAGLEAFGIVRHLVGEEALPPLLGDVDAQAGELPAARRGS